MNIAPDTNVLVRAIMEDDEGQAKLARMELAGAEIVAVTLPALCELVWVLARSYQISPVEIANAISRLVGSTNVVVNRPAVEAGLDMLKLGGDFADGAIAYEGKWLGGDDFVSFDKKAVRLLQARGNSARAPGPG
jgi:predicted nucleic-acid-binding protein